MTLEEVKAAIERLDRADRAMLRPWMLAVFEVDGSFTRPVHEQRAREEDLPL